MLSWIWVLVGIVGCKGPCADDADYDGDGVADGCDNCPFLPNEEQLDSDEDGFGNVCSCEATTVRCVDGFAGAYPCEGVDLASHVPLAAFGAAAANDAWGWTDPDNGREIAILGLNNGTGFVDISNPECPAPVAFLPAATSDSFWRDIETYGDHAYIVSEADLHGVQMVDLTTLPARPVIPERLDPTAAYTELGAAHTVSIDTETGLLVALGSDTCGGGLHVATLDPDGTPHFAGCFEDAGIAHDAQCTVYRGPDLEHEGKPICLVGMGFELTLSIVDLSEPTNPVEISRIDYGEMSLAQGGAGSAFAHQGWLTEDHRTFLFGDEFDESRLGVPTTTFVFDVVDLDAPTLIGEHTHETTAVDHQQYVVGDRVYQGNYTAGLRILDLENVRAGELREVAHFDVFPTNDARLFLGAWGLYPWFASGLVAVGSVEQGLFVLQPHERADLGGFDR
ncbi:MAG: choice-of-anchor B family protein [Myxococcales bacterium]|nr:choice-of-anchor B family protein [Myxococcales bacterium]